MSKHREMTENLRNEVVEEFNQAIKDGRVVGAEPVPVDGNVVSSTGNVSPDAVADELQEPAPEKEQKQEPDPAQETTSAPESDTPTVPEGMEGLIAENGLILGKYKTWDELRNGYMNLNRTLTSTLDENTALKGRIAGQGEVIPPAAPAPVSSAGVPSGDDLQLSAEDLAKNPAVARFAEETGADPASIGKLVGILYDQTMQAVMPKLQEQTSQTAAMKAEAEAEAAMKRLHPEAYAHAEEVQNFVRATPELADMVQRALKNGDRLYAMQLAWREYQQAAGLHQEKVTRAKSEEDESERKQARADAGGSPSPSAPVAAKELQQKPQPSREHLQNLMDRERMGDREAAAERRYLTYGSILPDWMFPNRQSRGN